MNQAKNRVYYIQDLKRLFASTSQTGVEGLMGFNALQSLEKKGIVKTLKRERESNTRMTRMGGKMEFWTDGTWIINSDVGLDILKSLINTFEKQNLVNDRYDENLERKPSYDLGR